MTSPGPLWCIGKQSAGVHEDPGADHVQRHQHAGEGDRDAEDHRDPADEFEQHVGRPGEGRQGTPASAKNRPTPARPPPKSYSSTVRTPRAGGGSVGRADPPP
jgi:hypothetical protein